MNVLATMLPDFAAHHPDPSEAFLPPSGGAEPLLALARVSLRDLLDADLLRGLPDDLLDSEHGQSAHLKLVRYTDWEERVARIPELSPLQFEQVPVWSTAVPWGDQAVVMPADRDPAPTAQLYTRSGERLARLVLHGEPADGSFIVHSAAVTGQDAHCPVSACGAGEACEGGCGDCVCGSFRLEGTCVTACYCPAHGSA